jgi:glutamine synthetase
MALTFMAKYDQREGNSCHIHLSFRGTDGALVMADEDAHGDDQRRATATSTATGTACPS